jgi:hypothetical protein
MGGLGVRGAGLVWLGPLDQGLFRGGRACVLGPNGPSAISTFPSSRGLDGCLDMFAELS